MGLFTFLKLLKLKKESSINLDPNEFIPLFWEDDYCQIEILPEDNIAFIKNQSEKINNLAQKSRAGLGFMETFERGPLPITTLSKEILASYLEYTLTGFDFLKARRIQYGQTEFLDCGKGKTKAFGLPNFTIFFETANEHVANIWIHIGSTVSVKQFDLIKSALYSLGEESALMLIDWNSLTLVDLRDRTQIDKYLRSCLKIV